MIFEYLPLAWRNVWNRKLRSSLTVLGIVIGIASIVALIAVSQGLENAINEQFELIGSNRLYVSPAGGGDFTSRSGLTEKDAEYLDGMPDFIWVNRYLVESSSVKFGREEQVFSNVWGFNPEDMERRWGDLDLDVKEGRLFKDGEKGVAIVAIRVAEDGFGRNIRVNNNIEINGKKLRVVGILEEIGNPEDDNAIWIPIETFRDILGKPEALTMIELVLKPGIEPLEGAIRVERRLKRIRDEESFEVITADQILDQLGNVLAIVQVVVVGIASISLIVGAVGIMNSMYTAVRERTSEIGIMKSLGAKNSDILGVFLIESAILGAGGGLLGVLLGSLIAFGVQTGAEAAGFQLLKVKIEFWLISFGLSFAVIVGMVSGAIPARQASKLQPVEALRA